MAKRNQGLKVRIKTNPRMQHRRRGQRADAKSTLIPVKKLVCPKNKPKCYYNTYYVRVDNPKYSAQRLKLKQKLTDKMLKEYGENIKIDIPTEYTPKLGKDVIGGKLLGDIATDAGVKNYIQRLIEKQIREMKPLLSDDPQELEKILKELNIKVNKQSKKGEGFDEYGKYTKQTQQVKVGDLFSFSINRYLYTPADGVQYVRYQIRKKYKSGIASDIEIVGRFERDPRTGKNKFVLEELKLGGDAQQNLNLLDEIMPAFMAQKLKETQGRFEIEAGVLQSLLKQFGDKAYQYLLNWGFTPENMNWSELKRTLRDMAKGNITPANARLYDILENSKSLDEFLLKYQKRGFFKFDRLLNQLKKFDPEKFQELFHRNLKFVANYTNPVGGSQSWNIIRADIFVLNKNKSPNHYTEVLLDETVIKDTPDLYYYTKEPILRVKLYHTYIDTLHKYLNRYAHIFGDKNLRKKFYSLVEKGTPVVQALQLLDKEFMENKKAGAYQLITKTQLREKGKEFVEEFFNKLVSSDKGTFKKLFQQINKEFEETLNAFQEKADEFIDLGDFHSTAGVPLPTLMKTYELFLDVFFSSLVSPLSDAKEEAEDKINRNKNND